MLFARSSDPPVLAALVPCAHPPPMLQQQHYLLRGIRVKGKQQTGLTSRSSAGHRPRGRYKPTDERHRLADRKVVSDFAPHYLPMGRAIHRMLRSGRLSADRQARFLSFAGVSSNLLPPKKKPRSTAAWFFRGFPPGKTFGVSGRRDLAWAIGAPASVASSVGRH